MKATEEIQNAFSSWYPLFREYIEGDDLGKIFKHLRSCSEKGKRIAPLSTDMLRCFRETDKDKLKMVLVGQAPYHTFDNDKPIADGLCMGCSYTVKTKGLQPSLSMFYDEMSREFNTEWNKNNNDYGDMRFYASQGVLCYNVSLATEEGKPGNFEELFSEFNRYFWEDVIGKYTKGLVLIFMGDVAQKSIKYVNPLQHYVLKCSHPASASHQGYDKWDSQGVFKQADKIIKDNYRDPIWFVGDLPF